MPDTTQTLSTQITSAMTRIGQEFNAVRTEIATGGAPTSADKVTLVGGKSVQEAIDDLNYVDPRITSFTNNVGTVEVGSTVTDITFNWKLNKTAKTLKFEGESFDVAVTTKKLTGQTLTANKNFTLEMTDARDKKVTATTGGVFRLPRLLGYFHRRDARHRRRPRACVLDAYDEPRPFDHGDCRRWSVHLLRYPGFFRHAEVCCRRL